MFKAYAKLTTGKVVQLGVFKDIFDAHEALCLRRPYNLYESWITSEPPKGGQVHYLLGWRSDAYSVSKRLGHIRNML